MKLQRSLNNNIALVLDDAGKEMVVIGRGISFHKNMGDDIDETKVEKCFVLQDSQNTSKLAELIQDIPTTYIIVAQEITEMIAHERQIVVSDSFLLSLIDHISVSFEREKRHESFENPLLSDIKTFYHDEFLLAQKANDIIFKYLNFYVSEDELGFITLHIVNVLSQQKIEDTVQITRSVSDITQIIEESYHITFDKKSIRYERLVRHLIFLIRRVISDSEEVIELPIKFKEDKILKECISRIDAYIYGRFGKKLENAEKKYLNYHILILTTKN